MFHRDQGTDLALKEEFVAYRIQGQNFMGRLLGLDEMGI